jgi:opacity protein-like surface antigen
MKKIFLAALAAAIMPLAPAAAASVDTAPATAVSAYNFGAYGYASPDAQASELQHGYNRDRRDRRYNRNRNREYDSNGYYREPRRMGRNDRVWRGRDGRYHCRRGNGTTGLIIGAGAGALLGREIDGGRDRTLGTILGAAGGGLLGREIDRGGVRCR